LEALRARSLEPALTSKQAAVLDVLRQSEKPLTTADVCRMAKCTPVPVQALLKRGLIHTVKRRLPAGPARALPSHERASRLAEGPVPTASNGGRESAAAGRSLTISAPTLTGEQGLALQRLIPALKAGGFAPFLIHGVTGSGKTEVYLSAIEHVVARGREAI